MSFRMADFRSQFPKELLEKPERPDGRAPDELRKVTITPRVNKHAEGSCLIEVGDTRVLCTASVEERVPPFLKGKGEGWVTAEYGMLPRATTTRMQREASSGRPSGRTHEIQRLVGRSLRAVIDQKLLGERTLWLDCDVLQADGGTRTASITGAFVALAEAVRALRKRGQLTQSPLIDLVAAVSVGKVRGKIRLDLGYEEDSSADVDMNVIKTGAGRFVEVQGTAEGHPFADEELTEMLAMADKGIQELVALQKAALGDLELRSNPSNPKP